MPGKYITALAVSRKSLEWTGARLVKNRIGRLDSGSVDFDFSRTGDETSVKESVSKLKSGLGRARGGVTLGLPSEEILLRVMDLPSADDEELAGMVELQVDKISPFPVDNMVVSHEKLLENGENSIVLAAAVRTELVEEFGRIPNEAGMSVKRVDAQAMGNWRQLKEEGRCDTEGLRLFVMMNPVVPEIIAVRHGVPVMFRSVGDITGFGEEDLVLELAAELRNALMSLELEWGQTSPPESICLCTREKEPPEKLAAGISGEFAGGIKVETLASMPQVSEGLVRRTVEGAKLDLTPKAWTAKGQSRRFKKHVTISACVLFGLWALTVGGFMGFLQVEKSRLSRLESGMKELREPAMEVREMRDRVQVIDRYMDRTRSLLECLREITVLQPAPPQVELTSFSYQKGKMVRIIGDAVSVEKVYNFSSKLNQSSLFSKTVLHGPRYDSRKRKHVFDIEIQLPGDKVE